MSATLWVGQTSDADITMLVPASFVDDIFDILTKRLETKNHEIINKVREGYADSTYLNLADLDSPEFQIVREVLLQHHAKLFEDFIYERLPQTARYRVEIFSVLKAGLVLDARSEGNLANTSITLALGEDKRLTALKWHFDFLLELIISSRREFLTTDDLKCLFSFWLDNSTTRDIRSLQNLILKNIQMLNLGYTTSPVISLFFTDFLPKLETFLTSA